MKHLVRGNHMDRVAIGVSGRRAVRFVGVPLVTGTSEGGKVKFAYWPTSRQMVNLTRGTPSADFSALKSAHRRRHPLARDRPRPRCCLFTWLTEVSGGASLVQLTQSPYGHFSPPGPAVPTPVLQWNRWSAARGRSNATSTFREGEEPSSHPMWGPARRESS